MIAETSKLLGTSHYLFYFILIQNEFINVLYNLTLFNIFSTFFFFFSFFLLLLLLFPLRNSVLDLPSFVYMLFHDTKYITTFYY